MENGKQTQPEKNVITDLADFIYLINHHHWAVFLIAPAAAAACR